jgi:hypothetical protein
MTRVNSYREIRAAAFFVRAIYGGIQTPFEVGAHRGYQMPASGKPKHTDLVRIDVSLRRMEAN